MDSERSAALQISVYFLIIGGIFVLLFGNLFSRSDETDGEQTTKERSLVATPQPAQQASVVNIGFSAPQAQVTLTPRPFNLLDNDAAYYSDLGGRYFDNGNFDEALRNYNYALALDPDNAAYYLDRGRVYAELRLLPLAAIDYERTLNLGVSPGAMAPHFANLGTISLNNRQHVQALDFFDRAIELNPQDARNYYLKARTYEIAGNWQGALRSYEQVIGMDAGMGYQILMTWGQVAQNTDSHEQAIDHFNRAMTLQPSNPEPYRRRAESYYKLGAKEQCLADLRRALELNPADAQTYITLGWYYEQEGDLHMADTYYRYAEQLTQC